MPPRKLYSSIVFILSIIITGCKSYSYYPNYLDRAQWQSDSLGMECYRESIVQQVRSDKSLFGLESARFFKIFGKANKTYTRENGEPYVYYYLKDGYEKSKYITVLLVVFKDNKVFHMLVFRPCG